mmetsp:Transcript_18044/g.56461  ORF Transcript_18044/g.56461 Transcript_18044/m.56461 type:complete len:441 (-) Transcript_18044:100-1422(-)
MPCCALRPCCTSTAPNRTAVASRMLETAPGGLRRLLSSRMICGVMTCANDAIVLRQLSSSALISWSDCSGASMSSVHEDRLLGGLRAESGAAECRVARRASRARVVGDAFRGGDAGRACMGRGATARGCPGLGDGGRGEAGCGDACLLPGDAWRGGEVPCRDRSARTGSVPGAGALLPGLPSSGCWPCLVSANAPACCAVETSTSRVPPHPLALTMPLPCPCVTSEAWTALRTPLQASWSSASADKGEDGEGASVVVAAYASWSASGCIAVDVVEVPPSKLPTAAPLGEGHLLSASARPPLLPGKRSGGTSRRTASRRGPASASLVTFIAAAALLASARAFICCARESSASLPPRGVDVAGLGLQERGVLGPPAQGCVGPRASSGVWESVCGASVVCESDAVVGIVGITPGAPSRGVACGGDTSAGIPGMATGPPSRGEA